MQQRLVLREKIQKVSNSTCAASHRQQDVRRAVCQRETLWKPVIRQVLSNRTDDTVLTFILRFECASLSKSEQGAFNAQMRSVLTRSVNTEVSMRAWASLVRKYMLSSAAPRDIIQAAQTLLRQEGGRYLEDRQMVFLKALFHRQEKITEDKKVYLPLFDILNNFFRQTRTGTDAGAVCQMYALLNILFYTPTADGLNLRELFQALPVSIHPGFRFKAESMCARIIDGDKILSRMQTVL